MTGVRHGDLMGGTDEFGTGHSFIALVGRSGAVYFVAL